MPPHLALTLMKLFWKSSFKYNKHPTLFKYKCKDKYKNTQINWDKIFVKDLWSQDKLISFIA